MQFDPTGKVAPVTGGGAGIGAAVNAAGIGTPYLHWRRVLSVNLDGVFLSKEQR